MHRSHDSNTLLERVHSSKLSIPKFTCEEGFRITQFCCNKQCRFQALSCSEEQCTTCLSQHEDCSFKSIVQLIRKWEGRTRTQKDMASKLFEIQKEAFTRFMRSQQKFMESIVLGKYESHSSTLRDIQMRSGNSGKCGKQMCQIFDSLSRKQHVDAVELIKTYKEEVSKVMLTLESERQAAFHCLFHDQNANQLDHSNRPPVKKIKMTSDTEFQLEEVVIEQLRQERDDVHSKEKEKIENIVGIKDQKGPKDQSSEIQEYYQQHATLEQDKSEKNEPQQQALKPPYLSINHPIIDSNILNNDPKGKSKIDFLFQQLGHPKRLNLLFRASEHSFNAFKFHKFCDNIGDTVSIIQTEFGRRVAGWTKVEWKTRGYWLQADEGQAFLLQLDLKEKYILKKRHHKMAVYGHYKFGPSFGSDLIISDQCDYNLESRTNFPHAYNCPTKKYQDTKKSKAILCGCKTDDGRFKVVEYEVFQVIR